MIVAMQQELKYLFYMFLLCLGLDLDQVNFTPS